MVLPLYTVDAFADAAFGGNPAAVCLLDTVRDDGWMQLLAREMNLSETAFVLSREDGYSLRWFTPGDEVDLCGHATLASAHILWEFGMLARDIPARFHTRSGLLTCTSRGDRVQMDFPAEPATAMIPPGGLLEALGTAAEWTGKNRMYFLVEVASEKIVREIKPNFKELASLETRAVIVTARADSAEYDFVSRFFAPGVGIEEDPVTGSAHCCLAPYWADRVGKNDLLGYQASNRGGKVWMQLAGDRVQLSGHAITVTRGELLM